MGVTNRLVYDPTDANSIAASSTIGAHTLAGDGTPIGHVSDALKVDIGSVADLDIRDLTHVSDSVKIGDGTDFLAVNADGSVNAVVSATDLDIRALTQTDEVTVYQGTDPWVVSATQLDIDDLNATDDAVQAWCFDGTGNAIGSTAGALDVNIASGDIDDSLANTAIANETVAVSTSAVAASASPLANRKWFYGVNVGNKMGYIGGASVTTGTGFPMYPDSPIELRAGASVALYYIGGAGASSEDYRTMQLS